jgi:hypothetical protein
MSMRRITARLVVAVTLLGSLLSVAAPPAQATTTVRYHAAYVEPAGGPQQSPFSCPLGTTCGSVSFSGLGHASDQVGEFNACGIGCHLRTVWFDDGSTLVLRTVDQPGPFAFTSPGSSGQSGYTAFGLPGNPQFLDIAETVIGGTGRFAGAIGGGAGTVKIAGGVAIGHTSGSITLL